MGDLEQQTTITTDAPGRYQGELSSDWNIWGPMGGYLAAFALRAAGHHAERFRPATINAHFLGGAREGPISLHCTTQRVTKVATSVAVTAHQDDRVVLGATIWGVDEIIPGLEHQIAMPEVPGFAGLASSEELQEQPSLYPFWENIEWRPLEWIADWDNRVETSPKYDGWFRFKPGAAFADPWVDACRHLVLTDVGGWPAAHRAHVGTIDYLAPTIEVTARFVGDTRSEPWLFAAATAPVAANGLIVHDASIWTPSGALVATGGSTMMCRPLQRVEARA